VTIGSSPRGDQSLWRGRRFGRDVFDRRCNVDRGGPKEKEGRAVENTTESLLEHAARPIAPAWIPLGLAPRCFVDVVCFWHALVRLSVGGVALSQADQKGADSLLCSRFLIVLC